MKYPKKRHSTNVEERDEQNNGQPRSVQNGQPGFGDKKLEGPNRPST